MKPSKFPEQEAYCISMPTFATPAIIPSTHTSGLWESLYDQLSEETEADICTQMDQHDMDSG